MVTQLALLAALLGGWAYLATDEVWINLVGSPTGVTTQLGEWFADPEFWSDIGLTALEAVLGYGLGVLIAIVLVAIIVPVNALDRFFAPFIAMANALPKIVLAPLFILWLGFSITSKVLFVAAGIFFLIFYGVYSGVRSIDHVLLDNARVLGATRGKIITDVYLPSIVGWLISSLRLSSAWALTGAVVSEYLGSNAGVGYRIALAQQTLDPSAVIAGIIAVAVLAVIVDRLLVLVERRYTQWRVF
ncbi:ABC transporter permease [Pseudonocardia kujensis]|uniref:ABC transporter permease n=1 Tax=Pseudonocardia kujensis TaxID=1128675 RepID=UPI001E29B66D|nr:ABC transporter permease [Pseudonocardia kujensis]MCE0763546.1 ABC transporter permease [Pseudonocardia kujensis]